MAMKWAKGPPPPRRRDTAVKRRCGMAPATGGPTRGWGRTSAIALAVVLLASLVSAPTNAREKTLQIGFVGTFTGPAAVLGQHMYNGFLLGVEHAGGKLGGVTTEISVVNSALKPEVAVRRINKLQDRVNLNFVVGFVFSNVLMRAYDAALNGDTFAISANAGPSEMAGRKCHKDFFSTSYQNDQIHGAVGAYLNETAHEALYLLAPDYEAGWDAISGFKRTFDGRIVGEHYTQLGRTDFSTDIDRIRAKEPDAVFAFLPGGMGVRFVKQYRDAGLHDSMPFYSAFAVDETTLPAMRDAGLGLRSASVWAYNLDNPANARFTRDFRSTYGYNPSAYAARGYDAAQLIDSAIEAVAGDLSDRSALRAALRRADFDSVRGDFEFNRNHFPIHDLYLTQAVQRENGRYAMRAKRVIREDHGDAYASQCDLTWSRSE